MTEESRGERHGPRHPIDRQPCFGEHLFHLHEAMRHFIVDRNLVIDIANSLPERMGHYAPGPPSEPEPQTSQHNPDSLLLDRLLHSKILRLLGPASKTWRRAVKERRKSKANVSLD